MKVENIDGIALKESDIKQVYGETIFYRGQDYFDVDLNNLQSECSCSYGINCKHGVAVLLKYMEGEYSDADKVTKSLDRMRREELRGVIDSLISANPSNLMYLGVQAEFGENPDGNLMEALDKQIESRLHRIMKSNGDNASADELASFIKVNESVLSKEQVFHILEFLVEFLINCGLTEKARTLIESSESLGEESRFRLYLRIDEGSALEFAYRNGAFSSLLKYYHDEVLRALFEKCISIQYFGLCTNIGLRLSDKELLRKLIDKESGYYFNMDEKIKVLEYLKEDYEEEVLREFKKLASSLINEMGARQYKKAAECVFLLRDCMNEEAWEEYVKGLYLGHSGKRNLWSEFKDRGIYLKMKKGEVTLMRNEIV